MNFIIKPRGYGKTYDIIHLAAANNGSILVANERFKTLIQQTLNRNHMEDSVKVYSINDLNKGKIPTGSKLYMDEANLILEGLIGNRYSCEICTLTLWGEKK